VTALRTTPRVALSEAAQTLGCSEKWIRHLVGDGLLPKVPHMGRRVLIPVAAIEKFANGQDPFA